MPNACAWPAGPAASAAGPATERKKNVPSTAMPMALPIWFTVESTPPAAPALRPGTPARTTSTRIGAARPSPRPPTKRARASSPYPGTVPSSTTAHSRFSAARNYWEFPATPIDAEVIGVIGAAISRRHVLRADRTGEGEPTTLTLEPHHLVVWAGRWYLVAFEPEADRWRAMRVDRLTPRMPTGRTFDRRPVPHGDPATFVMTTYDRGDTPAEWPCRGSALLALPASLVARFAPGGSTVEYVTDSTCRLTLGAWSWAGLAGLLLTFDADLAETEPAEVGQALHALRARIDRGIGPAGR